MCLFLFPELVIQTTACNCNLSSLWCLHRTAALFLQDMPPATGQRLKVTLEYLKGHPTLEPHTQLQSVAPPKESRTP